MFTHEKKLLRDVQVERPNPTYAAMLTEQLGGPQGEMKAAMQYMAQSIRIKDPAIKDLFMDIAAEELSHMEMVAHTISLLNDHTPNSQAVESGHIESQVLTGLTPALTNTSGYLWTAAYVNVTGDLAADLLSNIAAEQRAKVVYEYLYRQIADKYVRATIDFLLKREEAHNSLFRQALKRIEGTGSTQDFVADENSRLYFDLSTPGEYVSTLDPQSPAFKDPDPGATKH